MYRVNHNKKRLADEFLANPYGRPSPELQRVLIVFRGEPIKDKFVLVCTKPFQEWTLAQLTGWRGEPPRLLPDHRFSSLEDAERAVFRMRWRKHTGHDLD